MKLLYVLLIIIGNEVVLDDTAADYETCKRMGIELTTDFRDLYQKQDPFWVCLSFDFSGEEDEEIDG